MSESSACPLCESANSRFVRGIEVDALVQRWKDFFGIDVQGEFHGVHSIRFMECDTCGVGFFRPICVTGSPRLYQELGKFRWYYMARKWEHDVALRDLEGCKTGIEVGCGFGDFVQRAVRETGIAFEGCEQNVHAVEAAQAKGLRVSQNSLLDLAATQPNTYDAVCAFQVLEHAPNPGSLIRAACELLTPGGQLILGLPNAKGYLRHKNDLLDLPPHHMTRWTNDVLQRVGRWFPLKLERVVYEPLAVYHIDDYVGTYAALLSRSGLRILASPRIHSILVGVIRKSRIRRLLLGHTIYACYSRL